MFELHLSRDRNTNNNINKTHLPPVPLLYIVCLCPSQSQAIFTLPLSPSRHLHPLRHIQQKFATQIDDKIRIRVTLFSQWPSRLVCVRAPHFRCCILNRQTDRG